MELITMDSKAYQNLERKINEIAHFVYKTKHKTQKKWFTSREAENFLGISSRTLLRLRAARQIEYSMLNNRCRYRTSEVERVLNDRLVSSHPTTLAEIQEGYRNGNYSK